MKRRWAGVLILAALLVAAVLVPGFTGRKIEGIAQIAAARPGPPAVGDCVVEPVTAAAAALNAQLIYPPVSTGPCTDRRYGEVMSVITSSDIAPATRSAAGVQDPNIGNCRKAAARYGGGPTGFALGGGWEPASVPSVMAAGPTAPERSTGQSWIACVQYIDSEGPGQPRATDYRRTAQHAFDTGTPPAAFATCLQVVVAVETDQVSCHQPHAAELFARATGNSTTSRLLLDNTCEILISLYSRIPVQNSSPLIVTVNVYGNDGKLIPDSVANVSRYTATCFVEPPVGRQLTGPLMDLGNKPLPVK